MLDEPTPPPADFGLTTPLLPNTDHNLLLSASTRWNDCREQWLDLMGQKPRSALDEQWWSARARGTDVSRRDQAIRLYRQHVEASSQLALALGDLSLEEMNTLLTIIEPTRPHHDVHAIQISRPALKARDGRRVELAGAMVIALDSNRPHARLLYLPSAQTAWMSFARRSDMEAWLIAHPPALMGQPRFDTEAVSVDYTALYAPALQTGGQFLLSQLAVVADRQFGKTVFAAPAELPVADEVGNPALFGQLSPDIPLDQRRATLAQQQMALENHLGKDFQGNQLDPRQQRLQQQMDAVAAAEQASVVAATALLDTDHALKMLELRHLSNRHYPALYQARIDGLRAEADIQLSLAQISLQEHRWITSALDAPQAINRPEVTVSILTLSTSETEGANATPQSHELEGVLLFFPSSVQQQSASQSLLLYWPGRFGGLQRFASRQDLEQSLFKRLTSDDSHCLQLSTLSGNPFEYALQTQLYSCEQQAAQLIAANPVPSHASQREIELDNLREQTLARLTVPTVAARELAYAQLIEQNHSSGLAAQMPSSLSNLTQAQRARLKLLFTSYIKAMKRSHELLERDLPMRDEFSEKAVATRLRQDFGLTQEVTVTLDLPDSTTWQKVVTEGAAPGTPQQNVLIASQQRSKHSLAELALSNIDQAMWWRLTFMQVEINTVDNVARNTLKATITQTWLRQFITTLDLAGKYETRIREAFFGSVNASPFSLEHRRECLTEPWRLMLKLQGEFALLARDIDAEGQRLLDIAIDANSPQAFATEGRRIALLPAHLSVGGADTDKQGPSTLSGVTFITEQNSGLTLLYLPDSPDGIFVRQFDSLERARMALFNLCLRTGMVDYLAGRAVHGDVAQHVSRINQALIKNFDAMIGIGPAWPATTSLAAHLVNAHMGRLLEAHRATSRSNDALYLERCALQSGALFNYLKMALGVVPFVGTAVALYDAWSSANLAVAAFLRGDVGHGLAEVEAILLSLIDAAMDVLPGASVTAANARGATRQRQLKALGKNAGALQVSTPQQARRSLERFRGYEYESDISLAGLQPQTQGIYRNVYRHANGDFMIRHGRIYRIELQSNSRQWRLSGTRVRTYKQPIALDETGNWNTHYAVYGTVIEGGGAGGGAVLGHMADGLDPLWPAAIRRWLPRWWTDRAFRRQMTLTNTADAYTRRLDTQTRATNDILNEYFDLPAGQRQPLRARAESASVDDIEIAQAQYQNLEELLAFSHGRKRMQIEDIKSRCAWIITDRSVRRISMIQERLIAHLDHIDQLIARSDVVPPADTVTHLQLMAQRKKVRKEFLEDFDRLHTQVEQANRWNARITNRTQKTTIAPDMAIVNTKMSDANYYYLKTAHVLEIIARHDAVDDMSWIYFHVQLKNARSKVGRTLLTQHHLPDVSASFSQRNKVLEDCLATYAEFRRNLGAWTLGYPQHLDLEQVAVFLDNLEKVEESARNAIKNRPAQASKANRSGKQLFETEDNQLLIGEASTDEVTRQKRFTLEGVDGHREIWLPRSSGKYHLIPSAGSTQPPLLTDVGALLVEARKRLAHVDAYQRKVEGYARQDMLPIDLEHMMNSEALELSTRAHAIERLSPTDPVVMQLKNEAQRLKWAGRTLRMDQTMKSQTPTAGNLDYLLEQGVVEVRKEGVLRELGKRADGRKDFLQEYVVLDRVAVPPKPLWYAHFHYTSATPQFNDFVKGHLKLPAQRNLGLQWQQAQASSSARVDSIWRGDIGKPLAIKHFSGL